MPRGFGQSQQIRDIVWAGLPGLETFLAPPANAVRPSHNRPPGPAPMRPPIGTRSDPIRGPAGDDSQRPRPPPPSSSGDPAARSRARCRSARRLSLVWSGANAGDSCGAPAPRSPWPHMHHSKAGASRSPPSRRMPGCSRATLSGQHRAGKSPPSSWQSVRFSRVLTHGTCCQGPVQGRWSERRRFLSRPNPGLTGQPLAPSREGGRSGASLLLPTDPSATSTHPGVWRPDGGWMITLSGFATGPARSRAGGRRGSRAGPGPVGAEGPDGLTTRARPIRDKDPEDRRPGAVSR